MKAWLLPKIDSIENLRLGEMAAVPPGVGEVTLNVLYAALNPADRYLAEGLYPARPSFPHILGRDAVGVISQVGKNVTDWKVGDKALLLRGEAGVEARRAAVRVRGQHPGWEGLARTDGVAQLR